jgi:hypothetical protein
VACNRCMSSVFKDKIGRCNQCMAINLVLLIGLSGIYLLANVEQWLAVQRVAFLMFLMLTAILMGLHLIAWCYYRLTGT